MPRIFLHDEIKDILIENDNRWMTYEDIAQSVNNRGRYNQTARATKPCVLKGQIRSRVQKPEYSHFFEIEPERGRIKLN